MPHVVVAAKEKGTTIVLAQTGEEGQVTGWLPLRSLEERTIEDANPRVLTVWEDNHNRTRPDTVTAVVLTGKSSTPPKDSQPSMPLYGVAQPGPESIVLVNNEPLGEGIFERFGIIFEASP